MRTGTLVITSLALMLSLALAMTLIAPSCGASSAAWTTGGTEDPTNASNVGDGTSDSIIIHYFYGSGCSHCAMVEPHVDRLAEEYPQTTLVKYEVFFNAENQALFQDFNERYGVSYTGVPTIFIGDEALVGEDAIKSGLEPAIQRLIAAQDEPEPPRDNTTGNNTGPPANNTTDNNTGPPPNNATGPGDDRPAPGLTLPMVVVAALADSINPCAISVMVFLLIFLTGLGDRRRVVKVGAAYIATVYIVYFLAGLGALTFLHSTAMTRYVYYAAAGLSIAIGLVNIKDYFFFGKGPTVAIPESRKPTIKRYVEKASVPAAIVLGFAVSLFELPCTGGIYLAILSLLSNKMTTAAGVPYLALYNAIFVLPLVVILVIFLKGVTAERANAWRLEKRRTLKLVLGLVMLLLGAVMILEVL